MGLLDKLRRSKDEPAISKDEPAISTDEPACSVCGATHSMFVEAARAARAVRVYRVVGVCPTCRNAYCINHMIRAVEFMDFPKCPDDGGRLDFDWDKPQTPETPWRLGPKATDGASKWVEVLGGFDSSLARALIEIFSKAPDPEQARRVALELAVSGDPRAADALLEGVRGNAGQGGGRQDFVYPCLEALALLLDRAAQQVSSETLAALAKLHEERFYSPVFYEDLTLSKLLSNKEQDLPRVVERAQRELDRRASS